MWQKSAVKQEKFNVLLLAPIFLKGDSRQHQIFHTESQLYLFSLKGCNLKTPVLSEILKPLF